jgi:predicted MFS family arabinose efflux permease
MSTPYRQLLTVPSFITGLLAVMASAIGLGMMPLAVILAEAPRLTAGTALAAAFGLGNALGVPAQGVLMARLPASIVIGAGGALCCAALSAFLLTVDATSGIRGMLLFFSGISFPAITAAFLAWLPLRFASERSRTSAYALLSVGFQAAIAAGPVIAGLLGTWAARATGVAVAAGLVVVSTLIFLITRPESVTTPAKLRPPRSALRPFIGVLVIAGLCGLATGTLTGVVPIAAERAASPAFAGAVLACLAVGEACGALLFGALRRARSRRVELRFALSAACLLYVGAAAALPWIGAMAVAVFAIGAVISPVAIALSVLLDDSMPPAFIAGAYSMLVAVNVAGIAMGTAIAGLLIDGPVGLVGPLYAAATACAAGVLASVLILPGERRADEHGARRQ